MNQWWQLLPDIWELKIILFRNQGQMKRQGTMQRVEHVRPGMGHANPVDVSDEILCDAGGGFATCDFEQRQSLRKSIKRAVNSNSELDWDSSTESWYFLSLLHCPTVRWPVFTFERMERYSGTQGKLLQIDHSLDLPASKHHRIFHLLFPDPRQNSYREPPLPTPAANYSEDDDEEDTSFSQVRFYHLILP